MSTRVTGVLGACLLNFDESMPRFTVMASVALTSTICEEEEDPYLSHVRRRKLTYDCDGVGAV
jgi:hypothetical protein